MALLLSVVIPTKNEQDNVGPLVERVHAALRSLPYEIVFVDDSDDETPQAILGLTGSYPVRLIARSGKERTGGLAGAVVEGMKQSAGEYICVIDADLQHPPDQIPGLVAKARESDADMVVASRYSRGGSLKGLEGWRRNAISRACKWLARILLLGAARRLSDPLSGFFLVRRSLVASSDLRPVGYKIGLEILVRLRPRRVAEVPYEFAVRHSGRSKASLREGTLFLVHLLRLLRDVPESGRVWKFSFVGLLGALVFGTLILYGGYGDLPDLLRSLREFPLSYLALVLGLALVNYLIRWVRWLYYLRTLSVSLEASHNFLIFFSGLSMAISPGKVGELAKCYLLSEANQVPVSKSSPAVIMERVTDVVAVFALSAWGLTALPSRLVIIGGLVVATVATILAATVIFGRSLLLRLPVLKRWETQILDSQESFARLLSIKAILIGLALAILAWLSEGVGLWLVLRGLDTPLSFVHAVSIYATASLVGALIMLPGGIVGTEGSMVGLLRGMDLTRTDASAATIIIRLCTLWFAVLLGLTALGLFYWLVRRASPGPAEAGVD